MYVYKPAAVYKTIFYNQWHTLDCEGADTVHFRAHLGGGPAGKSWTCYDIVSTMTLLRLFPQLDKLIDVMVCSVPCQHGLQDSTRKFGWKKNANVFGRRKPLLYRQLLHCAWVLLHPCLAQYVSVSHPAVRRLFPAFCNLFILHV